MNEPVERCKAAWVALSTEAALVDESLALSEVHAVALMVSMLRAMVLHLGGAVASVRCSSHALEMTSWQVSQSVLLQVLARRYAVLLCLIALSQAYLCCCRLCRRAPSRHPCGQMGSQTATHLPRPRQ